MEPLSALEEKILREQAYGNFINTIQTDATTKIYRYAVLRYMDFHGFKSTTQMITGDKDQIEKNIVTFAKQKTVSKPTMSNYLSALKKFYKANRIKPDWDYIVSFNTGRHRKNNDRPYTIDEIRKILDFCDPRLRALVLLLASTGIRIGAVPLLKKRHLKAIDEYNLYQITVYEGDKQQYTTFCTPEARQAIDDYFAYRQRAGEILSPSSLVIRDKIDLTNPDKVKHARPYTENAVKKLLYDLIVRAGIKEVKRLVEGETFGRVRHEVQTSHGFRKFATSAMINSNLNSVTVDTLLGHKTGLMHVYHKPTDNQLLSEYLKAIDMLTIDPKNRLQRKVKQLESERDHVKKLQMELRVVERRMILQSRLEEARRHPGSYDIQYLENELRKPFSLTVDGIVQAETEIQEKAKGPRYDDYISGQSYHNIDSNEQE